MNTKPLELFAQAARRDLLAQAGARLDYVLGTDSAELRGQADAIEQLQTEVRRHGRQAVIDRAAYTWFNRFCALRFMDANRYTPLGIVSPAPGHTQPEILAEAKAGHIDPAFPFKDGPQRVLDLLAGRAPSRDGHGEAYRLLLVAACNRYHTEMPFLFERIADWTELLLPDDLLSAGSVLHAARQTLTEEVCQDVEVIGWLYQFYISERKDAVIGSKQKIKAEDIPAATQLFTPHWIVRYLVENSLGRLWLLNWPNSRLAERMEYYIRPEQEETGFLRVNSPEELRLCDPACGSGHMLTYAFDLLYAIYEEEGYNPPDIPMLILSKNLTGLEIDERAGDLAAFALMMKGRARDRRFFSRDVHPDIVVLSPPEIDREELARAGWFRELGRTLLERPLQEALLTDLHYLDQADNLGSLIRPRLTTEQIEELRGRVGGATDLLNHALNTKVLDALDQLAALARPYHVVVTNPPYMGNLNDDLKKFVNAVYADSKSDLFAVFIERCLVLAHKNGLVGMITMQSWMFLSSYEKLRAKLLGGETILSMAHLGTRAFDTIGGEVVSTTAFILERAYRPEHPGAFLRLIDGRSEAEKSGMALEAIRNPDCDWVYRASAADFKKIPGSPLAYWIGPEMVRLFEYPNANSVTKLREGIHTANNELFLRRWAEVSRSKLSIDCRSSQDIDAKGVKWIPYNKGGGYRKWYGLNELAIAFDSASRDAMADLPFHVRPSQSLYFKEGGTWSALASGKFGLRYYPEGYLFDSKGQVAVGGKFKEIIVEFNTNLFQFLADTIMPTLDYKCGDVKKLPYLEIGCKNSSGSFLSLVSIGKTDWDAYETSWDFTTMPLLRPEHRRNTLSATYAALREQRRAMTREMQRLEEENNRIFIDAYSLGDELSPEVPLNDITLTCNPHFRYDSNKPESELEAQLLADTLREFISYAVGCLFGRYSLDESGLILADAGATVDDYLRRVPNPTFAPDRDGVLPILDGDWFPDDIVGRFKGFLRATFGDARYEENLSFIEAALGRDLRSYFLREFYDHHIKTYKKRPIYWLFSSPGGSFNALIYLHRYRPDTVSVVLNDYLRDYRSKLESHRDNLKRVSVSGAATPREKTQALRELEKLEKTLAELRDYESEVLYPLATQRVELDLDDGVKVNYNKLGRALKKVTGLSE